MLYTQTEQEYDNYCFDCLKENMTEEKKENICPLCGNKLHLETCGIPPDDLYDVLICLNCFWSERQGGLTLEEELESIPF